MPKVTFILRDGTQKTIEFEHGQLPFQEHGLRESFLDIAMNCGISLEHAVLDLSGIDRPCLGEIVTILGQDGEARLTLEDIAQWQGVGESDVLMGLDGRMPRIEF